MNAASAKSVEQPQHVVEFSWFLEEKGCEYKSWVHIHGPSCIRHKDCPYTFFIEMDPQPPSYDRAVAGNAGPAAPSAPPMETNGADVRPAAIKTQPPHGPMTPGGNTGRSHVAIDVPTNPALKGEITQQQLVAMDGSLSVGQCFSGFLHLVVYACIIALVILLFEGRLFDAIWPGVVGGICFIGILIEAMCSNTMEYLNNFKQLQGIKEYVGQVKGAAPTIDMNIKCYHDETRTRTVSHTDNDGNTQYNTETYTVEVVTHRESERFNYNSWRDVSKEIKGIHPDKPTRVVCSASYRFKDEASRQAFYNQYQSLQDRNRNRDKFMDHSLTFEVPHFKPRVTAYLDGRSTGSCYSAECFCCATLLLVSFCYRCWFRSQTAKARFDCVKELSM